MSINDLTPLTPITSKADRSDFKVRLLEEAVLELRGDWPAAAYGLTETVNRASGFIFGRSADLDAAIEAAMCEALLLVESLYGLGAVADVRLRAGDDPRAAAPPPSPSARAGRVRKRLRWPPAPSSRRIGVGVHT